MDFLGDMNVNLISIEWFSVLKLHISWHFENVFKNTLHYWLSLQLIFTELTQVECKHHYFLSHWLTLKIDSFEAQVEFQLFQHFFYIKKSENSNFLEKVLLFYSFKCPKFLSKLVNKSKACKQSSIWTWKQKQLWLVSKNVPQMKKTLFYRFFF